MDHLPRILICDDDSTQHLAIKHSLKGKYDCRSAYNPDEALTILKKQAIDVLLLDIQMRTPTEGLDSIAQFKAVDEDISIVMMSGLTEFHAVRDAMRLGATDYVAKNADPDELLHALNRVLEKRNLLQRREQQNYEVNTQQRQHILVGQSPQIQALKRTIERMRQSGANVVITGETGTGKEVIARQLRGNLPDGSLAPFVAVDSSTIQSSMAEGLLFGYEKGAFTGADRQNKGLFEEANGGIVYFDEIANMPLEIQAKLLRVLQEKEVVRLGSTKVLKLDFRVVCASNKNLEDMVQKGQFKDDLLQRLNVLPIQVPPLRERKEDIPLLVQHFLQRQPGDSGNLTFTEDALDYLKAYDWPGNIRELGNVVSYLVAMTEGTEVDVSDLPHKFRDLKPTSSASKTSPAPDSSESFYAKVASYEKELLKQAYDKSNGNISQLALSLAMDRSHLYTKLREYGIHTGKGKKDKT